MTKVKSGGKKYAAKMESLKATKHGFVQKNKNSKYKQTPSGKVNLINGSNAQNNQKEQKQFGKGKGGSPQKSPNNSGHKQFSKNNTKKQKQLNKKKTNSPKALVPEEDDSESDQDYNEGIVVNEQISFADEDDSISEESEDDDVPDIFGTSLADDTDEDDNEFDDSVESEDKNAPEKKGVKMFKGTQSKNKSTDSTIDTSGTDLNSSFASTKSGTSNDDEDDDESEEEEEDEHEESALGLKALLGNSIAEDDEDDEDFVEEGEDDEDEDISDEDEDEEDVKNETKERTSLSPQQELEKIKKTIYIGNLPKEIKKSQIEKLFNKFGAISSIRVRGAIPENQAMPKKVAAITKKLHAKLQSLHAYVVFKSEESVAKSLTMNGKVFDGRYLRVDSLSETSERDPKKCVFLGNLPFQIDQNSVWEHFKQCGQIQGVRLIKDNKTGVGKGIGYVNFMTEDAAALALELDGKKVWDREIRVKPYKQSEQSKGGKKRNLSSESESSSSPKKLKNNTESAVQRKGNSPKGAKSLQEKGAFAGQKADIKKKKKGNKFEQKKKLMAQKLTAKTKKSKN